jgi:uroporphyrinogen decarboxylase
VGLTNLFELLASEPDLIDYISQKILEQNIEDIRSHASAGGDAIYIDDATATSDMISVKHYERFCLPYMKQMVDEIHRLGHKAILIYFGGITDRLDQISSLGADGLSMETSMKGYTNDIEQIARRIGSQVTLFGNIDPVGVLQSGTDVELAAEVRRQAQASQYARGFIMCTGSPITPFTPLSRVQRFIELSRAA